MVWFVGIGRTAAAWRRTRARNISCLRADQNCTVTQTNMVAFGTAERETERVDHPFRHSSIRHPGGANLPRVLTAARRR
jgi:hypothetical protein